MNILVPDKEFFSIAEVSRLTEIEPYTLRYWEGEFKLLRPARRVSGHRKYTKKDIELVFSIKDLLRARRFTIEGAKKFLLKQKKERPEQLRIDLGESSAAISLLKETKKTLVDILKILG